MKKFLSLVLALVMTMSLVTISAGAEDFTDDSKITYGEAVDVMTAIGVVGGYADGSFNPTAGLTRGAAAKIICNMILGPTTASALSADTAPYSDVAIDNTFAGYIAYCAQQGIISGYADGTFRPAAPLTSYAFMKMLLGALGYDADVEGYTGANWSIQVAKRALNIGLDDGLVDAFVGTKAVTREEACLYAFNAMQADMVEYDTKTSISIGDADVVIAGSNAEVVAQGSYKNNMNKAGLQFAEKYFENLKKQADRDNFMRPATTWKVKSVEVGTYTNTPDLSYTAGVKAGAIYSDLGSKVAKEDVTVYVNGVEKTAYATAISKGSDVKVGEYGNGVLTEVYYNDDAETAEIIQVLTYVGQVEKTVKATATKDAYIVLSDASTIPTHPAPGSPLNYETDEKFDDDTIVYYTYSEMASVDAVQSVEVAEIVTGTVARAENKDTDVQESQNLTIDGETYKTAYWFGGIEVGNVTVKEDYNVYLDGNGYAILVEKVDDLSSEYALLKDYRDGSDWSTNKALLVFADGTEKIVDTDKNYKKVGTSYFIDISTNDKIVTWKQNEDGEYALREVKASGSPATVYKAANQYFDLDTDRASITTDTGVTVYGNSASVFVVEDVTNDSWDAYTGVKSVPTVKSNDSLVNASWADSEKVAAYYYVKNGMVKIMFVLPGSDALVTNDSTKVTFIAKDSVSNLIHDAEGDYFEYNAIVNGEIKTIKVDDSLGNAKNGFFSNYKFNKYNVMTDLTAKTSVGGGDTVYSGETGINKTSEDYTILFAKSGSGYTYTRTVDEDAAIYYVDEDGVITESSYGAIVKDDNDLVYAIEKSDGMIHTLVIEEVDDDEIPAGPVSSSDYAASAAITAPGAITVKAKNGTSALNVRATAIAMLREAGYTDISASGMRLTATDEYGLTETFTVAVENAYKVTFTGSACTLSVASIYMAEGDTVKITVDDASDSWTGWTVSSSSGLLTVGTGDDYVLNNNGESITVTITAGNLSADTACTLTPASI